jgi:hypothetical protein
MRADLAKRYKASGETLGPTRCTIPGCQRPTMAAAGHGHAAFHCRYHVQFRSRHGSHWRPSYRATELRPYLEAAQRWLKANRHIPHVVAALAWLDALLGGSGKVDPAQNIRRKPAAYKARVAFARLRQKGVMPDRVLATYLGMMALIEDDRGSHRTEEFREVQTAKALHRLASGTHKRWEYEAPGGMTTIRLDAYPRSSGLMLRLMGEAVAEHGRAVAELALWPIIYLKRERNGLHPSHLPGWKPLWQLQREEASR